jgi:hypothetical protein
MLIKINKKSMTEMAAIMLAVILNQEIGIEFAELIVSDKTYDYTVTGPSSQVIVLSMLPQYVNLSHLADDSAFVEWRD